MAAECNEVYGESQPAVINNECLEVPFIMSARETAYPHAKQTI